MTKYISFLVVGVCGALGLYLLKTGINSHTTSSLNFRDFIGKFSVFATDFRILSAIALYIFAMIAMMYVIAKFDVSFGFPVALGVNLLLTMLMAVFFLGEAISTFRAFGIVCIMVGVFFINSS